MACAGLSSHQLYIFVLGWVGYAVTYALRKPLGVVKGDMQTDLGLSSSALGWMDATLILPYAVFQMLLSSIGDRMGAGYTFGICLILDGIVMCTFGWWSSLHIFMLLLFLNGTCQSICWPNAIKVLGTWFPTGSARGTVFGMFGTSAFAGGFLGTSLIVYLQTTYSWRSAFLLPSFIVSLTGVVVLLTYREARESPIVQPAVAEKGEASAAVQSPASTASPKWSSLWSIRLVREVALCVFCLKLVRYLIYMWLPLFLYAGTGSRGGDSGPVYIDPGTLTSCSLVLRLVPEVAIAALCIKVVRYAFYGWLPLYLYQHLKYSKGQAGMFSTMFDIGGVFGSAFIGVFINKFFQGRAIHGCMVGILISTVSLAAFMMTTAWGVTVHSVLLFTAGAFNCGPDTILVSLVPADIGNRDGRNAAAAVTGLINGFGSLGSVIQGPVVGWILEVSGWPAVLLFMVATSGLGTVVALKAALMDRSIPSPTHSRTTTASVA